MENLQEKIVQLLKMHQLTIATAESVTAGMISNFIANIPGASKVLKGGVVVYTNEAKIKLAKVKKDTISHYGAVSKQTAMELAYNIAHILKTDIGLSITGNAGPEPMENQPVGMAYLGICIVDKTYVYELHTKSTSRNDIRVELAYLSFKNLLELLGKVIK